MGFNAYNFAPGQHTGVNPWGCQAFPAGCAVWLLLSLTEQQPLRLAPHDNLTGAPVPNERRPINQIAFRDLLQDASLEFVSAAAADHNIRSALWFLSHNISP